MRSANLNPNSAGNRCAVRSRSSAAEAAAVIGLAALLATAASSATPRDKVPRFETGPCEFRPGNWAQQVRLECGHLIVAQDRSHPEGRTFRLAVAILRAKEPSKMPPLVMLHGGPSGPGGLIAGEINLAGRWAPRLERDVIVYDQRGAGASEPPLSTLCLVPDAVQPRELPSPRERQEGYDANARACVATLRAQGIDPEAFSSAVNAQDLIDLRTTLGYRSWDLFGVSYGSRLVQEAMQRDPNSIHSVILGSPNPREPLFEAVAALSFERTLDHLFVACAAQRSCATAFPTFERDFFALYDEH
jgi:pimeloyl-ACP methyl ester carboxylesterase